MVQQHTLMPSQINIRKTLRQNTAAQNGKRRMYLKVTLFMHDAPSFIVTYKCCCLNCSMQARHTLKIAISLKVAS